MVYDIHPVIRVVCFILFALFLALGSPSHIWLGILLPAILYAVSGLSGGKRAWPMLRRMRWFFLSILLVYLFMTPGVPLFPLVDDAWWLPTREGALAGGHRILALVFMVLTVNWLLHHTPRSDLVSALYRLVWPLSWFGFSRERFAVRIALVFDALEPVQQQVAKRAEQIKGGRKDVGRYSGIAAGLVTDVIALSEETENAPMEIDIAEAPPLIQWGWVFLLGAILLLPGLVA